MFLLHKKCKLKPNCKSVKKKKIIISGTVPDSIDTMNVVPDGSFEIGTVREREGGHIAESLV